MDGFLYLVAGEALRVALKAEIGVPAAGDVRTTPRAMDDALASPAVQTFDGGGRDRRARRASASVVTFTSATVRRQARRPRPGALVLQETVLELRARASPSPGSCD